MKEHTLCALQSNTPHLRSTTQNICFRISIFAVILKDKWSKSHLFLAHIAWHDIFSLSDHFQVSWNLYISHDLAASKSKCSSSRQSNLQVLQPSYSSESACLKFDKNSNRAVENLPQRKLWVWAANDARSHKNLITPNLGERMLLRER